MVNEPATSPCLHTFQDRKVLFAKWDGAEPEKDPLGLILQISQVSVIKLLPYIYYFFMRGLCKLPALCG